MAISNGVEPFRRSTALRSAPLWISNFASFVRLLDETAKCNAVRPRGTNVTENEKKHQKKIIKSEKFQCSSITIFLSCIYICTFFDEHLRNILKTYEWIDQNENDTSRLFLVLERFSIPLDSYRYFFYWEMFYTMCCFNLNTLLKIRFT